ncbi:MAG: hypothetical protein JWL90_1875 [Chthoniobacteraceae bacterium]|nr:hypothetical protein [Chthoniobacteraceae bacterium]
MTFNPNDGSNPNLVLTGAGTGYAANPGFVTGVGGQLGTLLGDFNYNGHPGVVTLNNLTVGQTYVFTAYNARFGSAGGRVNTVTSATSGVSSGLFDENISPLSLLRYTFTASQASEVINFTPLAFNDTYHFYGFSSEQVFDNNRSVGGNWTDANWSKGVPTASGSNASFAAPAVASTINLDTNQTVGHVQFAGTGANSWTLSSTNSSVLTIQADVAGVAVLSTPDAGGTHIISTAVTLGSDLIKAGAGRLVFSGAVIDNGKAINLGNGALEIASSAPQTLSGPVSGSGALVKSGAGTLTLSGALSYTGNTTIAAGTLEIASASTLGSVINGAGGLLKSGAATLTLTGNNTYTGNTVVSGGVLKLQGLNAVAAAVGTAAYTNSASYSFTPANNNLLTSGGTLIANTNTNARSENTGGSGMLTDSAIPAFKFTSTYVVANNAALTYKLGSSVTGYDLTTINLFSQWQDSGRAKITLTDISYSTVANPTVFTAIPGSNDDFAGGGGTNLASLNATGGLLASGVSAVRFNFGTQLNGYDGYGELEVVGTASVATGTNILPASSAVQIASGATLDLNGVTQTVASLANFGANGGSVINGAAATPVTLTLNPAGGTTTFSGTITDTNSANAISMVKSGNGTQVLDGANTYHGATTVNGGTLTVTGSISGSTAINVAQGTLLLSADNAVNSPTSVLTLGATGSSGTLQLANSLANASESFGLLALNSNSTLDFGTGTGGQDLLFAGVGTHVAGTTLSILNWSGTGTTLGTTASDRLLFSGNASEFTSAFTQNDVVFATFGSGYRAIPFTGGYEIVAVPEPTSAALLGAISLGFAGLRKRRSSGNRNAA